MEFKVRCVRECLLRLGHVYTVRAYDAAEGWVWVDGFGRCYRRQVTELQSVRDLEPFVTYSGFGSVQDWWQAILSFGNYRKRRWLYYVALRVGE